MSWCLLRGETRSLALNVVDFHFDQGREACGRYRGSLTVEMPAECDRSALNDVAHNREAVVLERTGASAVEMRLLHEAPTSQTICVRALTYKWVTA